MSDNVSTIDRLSEDLSANPDLIDQLLVEKFDLDALMQGADDLGYEMSDEDVEAYLEEKFPKGGASADMKFYVPDTENGDIRELSPEEAEGVGGGFAVALGVVVVAGVAYVAAVVITLAFGFTAGAVAALAVATVAGV